MNEGNGSDSFRFRLPDVLKGKLKTGTFFIAAGIRETHSVFLPLSLGSVKSFTLGFITEIS